MIYKILNSLTSNDSIFDLFTIVIALGLPFLLHTLVEYKDENLIIKNELKNIINKKFFLTNLLLVISVSILGAISTDEELKVITISNKVIISLKFIIYVFFLEFWVSCCTQFFKVLYNKDEIIKSNLTNTSVDELHSILHHSLEKGISSRVEIVVNYVLTSRNDHRTKYLVFNAIKNNNTVHNLISYLNLYHTSSDPILELFVGELYLELDANNRKNIDDVILLKNNGQALFIHKYTFIIKKLNRADIETSPLFIAIMTINIRNNFYRILESEKDTIILFNFFKASIDISNEKTKNKMVFDFMEIVKLASYRIKQERDLNKQRTMLYNSELFAILFLHFLEEIKHPRLRRIYRKTIVNLLSYIYFRDVSPTTIQNEFKAKFLSQNEATIATIPDLQQFKSHVKNKHDIIIDLNPINGFNFSDIRLNIKSQSAQTISCEDYLSHLIGMFYLVKVLHYNIYYNNITQTQFPFKTKNFTVLSDNFYTQNYYYKNWFYNFIKSRNIIEYHVACSETHLNFIKNHYYILEELPKGNNKPTLIKNEDNIAIPINTNHFRI